MIGFGISNFRSFDDNGVMLDNLNKINVIIGKNNSGKSNVLRFLQLINANINNFENFPKDIQNQHRRNGQNTFLHIKVLGREIIDDTSRISTLHGYHKHLVSPIFVKYNINEQKSVLPDEIVNLSDAELLQIQNHYSQANREKLLEVIQDKCNRLLRIRITNAFKNLIYIPHLRVIKEGHPFGDSNSSINGANIISKMFEMQNPTIGAEKSKDKFIQIRDFVRSLINKPDLEIEIPHTRDSIVLTIDDNRLPLDSFGTGIHQLVMLCSTLVIHEDSVVCIEEPEIHLHPELQRKFLNFLAQTKNTYYITTHSNIFLDSKSKTSVYHVMNDGIKTTIIYADRNNKTFSILNDLGYHASDIMQTNGVIWVEGPSDRTYLLKWIELLDSELIEGIHFSIMFYGGRLLSHLTFDATKTITELIPMLKLNRNSFVIIDRDGFTSNAKLNDTKKRIKEELGDRKCWITKGREIENYISKSTLIKWVGNDTITTNSNSKIEDIISKVSKIKYNSGKTKYAKELIKHIEPDDINTLDLKMRLTQLLTSIRSWNE